MALCELRVHVLAARDVKRPNAHSQVYHRAVVSLPGLTRLTQQTETSRRPDDPKWDQTFSFNVPIDRIAKDKMVNVKIFGDKDWFCGQANIPILGVKDSQPHRYPLVDEGGIQHGIVKIGVDIKLPGEGSSIAPPPPSGSEERPSHRSSSSSRPKTSSSRSSRPTDGSSRPALSVVTLESEVKRPSTSHSSKNSKTSSDKPKVTITRDPPPPRQTLASAGRSQSLHVSDQQQPTRKVYVKPSSQQGSFPAPTIIPSATAARSANKPAAAAAVNGAPPADPMSLPAGKMMPHRTYNLAFGSATQPVQFTASKLKAPAGPAKSTACADMLDDDYSDSD